MAQFHIDYYSYGEVGPWVDGTMAYAAGLQIPMWTDPALAAVRRGEGRHRHHQRRLVGQRQGADLHRLAAQPAPRPTPCWCRRRSAATRWPPSPSTVPQRHGAVARRQRAYDARHYPYRRRRPAASRCSTACRRRQIAIGDVTVIEGHTGTTVANLPLTLSSPSSNSVTVNYQTVNGTATQPGDYQTGVRDDHLRAVRRPAGSCRSPSSATWRSSPTRPSRSPSRPPATPPSTTARASSPSSTTTRRRRSRSPTPRSPKATPARRRPPSPSSLSHASGTTRQRAVRDGERHRDRRRRLHRRQRHADVQPRRHVAADSWCR